jgi:uncharacterized protein (TIGR03437 family)
MRVSNRCALSLAAMLLGLMLVLRAALAGPTTVPSSAAGNSAYAAATPVTKSFTAATSAGGITWYLDGVTLSGGGSLTGSITYDSDANILVSWSIMSSPGAPAISCPANGCVWTSATDANTVFGIGVVADTPTFTSFALGTIDGESLLIALAGQLTDAGGTVPMVGLSPGGCHEGNPASPGCVLNGNGPTGADIAGSLTTVPPSGTLQITTASLPNATSGTPYSTALAASGGSGTGYTWTLSSGSLPAGFTLSSAGILSSTGSPAAPSNSYSFTVQVVDSASNTATQPLTLNVVPPPPIVTSLSPPSATAGGPALTLTVNGSGFLSGATVQWNSSPLVTTYVNGNELTAVVPASLTAAPGSAGVTVVNPGGSGSNVATFTISPPPSSISGLSPSSALAGGPGFTLTVTGSGFLPGATVDWNGSPLATTYVNASQLTAQVLTSQIAAPGTASVTVVNPGGAGSNPATFPINAPTPRISGLIPSSASAGGPPFTLTVNGSGFLPGATVRWNGSPLVTSYVNGSQLTAAVSAGLIAASGSASVTVVNPAGGLASNAVTFTVAPSTIFTAPQSLNFSYEEGGSTPAPQTFSVFSNGAAVKYSAMASVNWLKVVAATGQTPDNVTVSLQNLSSLPACAGPAPCSDTATVTITPLDSAVGAPSPVNVTLTVIPVQPLLSVWPTYLTVSSVTGAIDLQRQVQVFNTGGGTLNYTVTPPSVPWLSVSCGASGAVTLTTPASVCLTLSPAALQPGNYHAPLVIIGGAGVQPATVNVTLQVTEAEPLVLLLPGAMEFTAVSGGQTPAPQTLNVLNIGTGTMEWSAQASTINQSGKWLQLSTSGCASASQTVPGSATSGGPAGSLTVCVDLAQAALGGNYGQIAVSVPNGPTGNSEVIAVLLNVLAGGSALPELAAPTGVILRATPGTPAPTGSVTLSNPNGTPIGFTTTTATQDGTAWLSVSQPSGSLAGYSTAPLQVQGSAAALGVGIYHGQVRVGFSDGTSAVINVILAVSPGSGAASVSASARGRREHPMASPPNCPGGTVLPPQFINLSEQGFQVQAGSVQQLLVQVQDSCGNQITDKDVGATLSVVIYNSATQATLETPNLVYSDTQKAWQYGWTPTSAEVGPIGMYAVAGVGVGNNSIGNRSDIWTGTVMGEAAGGPAEPTAVANAASVNLDTIVQVNQVAAGSYITIYGDLLADPPTAIPYPFPTEDQGSTVLLGGVPLLLEYVSPTQVNALVPTTAGLPLNAPLPLKIQRDGTLSVPDLQVSVTTVQPAIFIVDQNSQGAVLIAGTSDIVAPVGNWPGSRPAQAGVDYIEIFCNGLGPVTNPPVDGQPALANPLSWTVTIPQVTIGTGGVPVPAAFSGLSPGLVALYQVNVQVPAGTQTGDAVPITIQMGDVASNTVYIAVQ